MNYDVDSVIALQNLGGEAEYDGNKSSTIKRYSPNSSSSLPPSEKELIKIIADNEPDVYRKLIILLGKNRRPVDAVRFISTNWKN